MKNRGLIVALGILVALAVLATALVLHRHSAAKPAAPPALSKVEGAARHVAVRPNRLAAPGRKIARAPAAPQVSAEPESAESAQPVVAEPPSLEPLALADPATFVASLSDHEFRDLIDVLRQKQGVKSRQEQRYKTNADLRLSFLNMAMVNTNNNLKLTPAQLAQIDQFKAAYKPQMDALLADVWAKQEDTATLLEAGRRGLQTTEDYANFNQENQALLQQQKDLLQKADEISQPLTSQYAAAVRLILTPEQQKTFDNVQVERMTGGGTKMTLQNKDDNGRTQGSITIIH